MAIAQTATGTQGNDNSNPVTMAFDCNGGDLLVLGLCTNYNRTGAVPTYNGVNMTASPEGNVLSGASESSVEMFYLVNPASGSNTISIPNTGISTITPITSAWSGVDTADPLDTSNSDFNAGSANPSVTVTTTTTGELIIDVLMDGQGQVPTANSHTLISSVDQGGHSSNAQYTLDDGTSGITLDYTVTIDDWAMIVCAFKVASDITFGDRPVYMWTGSAWVLVNTVGDV